MKVWVIVMSRLEDVLEQEMKLYQKDIKEAYRELRKYKSLEEELGIDLIIFFKAMKDGIYYKNPFTKKIKFAENLVLCKSTTNEFYFSGFSGCLDLKDFNKTWWLEKPKENDDERNQK